MRGRSTGAELEKLIRDVNRALVDRDIGFFEEFVHPELEFRSLIGGSEGRVYRGIDGMREFFADIDDAFDGVRWESLRVIEISEDVAVVEIRVSGQGKASGAPFELTTSQVWTWRDGRPWRNEVFADLDAALETARSGE